MKNKCEYCGAYIEDTEEKCPNCGAVNKYLQRQSIGVPKTIEELKQWYKDHNLPPEEKTRFFIGKNYTKAKAFGIYKDEITGEFVVYKNKANSVRAIRYRGKDEAYAVNELYMRLKEEIVNQKQNNINNKKRSSFKDRKEYYKNNPKALIMTVIIDICLIVIIGYLILSFIHGIRPKSGYYYFDNTYYYFQGFTWYEYDDTDGWNKSSGSLELFCNSSSYYESDTYDSSYYIDGFENSSYYDSSSTSGIISWLDSDWESDSSWDSGSSWDSSDSWDSGSTDWDSDW